MNKTKFSHKIIAVFLTLNFLSTLIPVNQLLASNNGPNAPEASNFEPVSATDMVNLSSGDMAYVLPLLEVDGFPVTLSYHAGIPMDMEASWVGLGWNINTGAIARGVVANPDDWGVGRRLNLTYLSGYAESYNVDVGVGIGETAEVGVGLSWGSNKSMSGSVSASVGPLSASISTNGNYSLGVGSGIFSDGPFSPPKNDGTDGFGGSLSISGNVNKGGVSANIGVGGSKNGMSGSMGVSISGNGMGSSFSVGGNNKTSTNSKSNSASGSVSMNSFSAGDYSYNTKGIYVPINIGIMNFGFGYSKTKIEMKRGFNKYGYGILYHNASSLYNTNLENDDLGNNYNAGIDDYQVRNRFGDVYEQALPQSEKEFIGDYRNQIEKLNFTFGGYDSYEINASGIGGALRPIVGQNTVLIGEGYDGVSIRGNNAEDKTKIFYHNADSSLQPNKSLSYDNTTANKLNFSFDGQITENAIVTNASINNYSGSTLNLSNFINAGNSIVSRPKSGSYIETYTNAQIDAGGTNLLIPSSLKTGSSTSVGSTTRNTAGYISDGIGGYKITAPDGKTYHFSQPVYQYEQVQHNFLDFDAINTSKYNSSSKREATPYATHWLLSAITGPDFVDVNNNDYADEEDYGYWLRLDHGQWSNAYTWRSPYDHRMYINDGSISSMAERSRKHYATFIDKEVEKSDPGYFLQGRKDLYYLNKIVSKNQTAVFVKDLRNDGFGTSADYVFGEHDSEGSSGYGSVGTNDINKVNDPIEGLNKATAFEVAKYDREYQLKLNKIIIIDKPETEIAISKGAGSNLGGQSSVNKTNQYYTDGFFYKNLPVNSRTHNLHQVDNVIDVNDVQSFDYSKASKVIKFNHSYDLAKNTPSSGYHVTAPESNPNNSGFGRLTLDSLKIYGRGKVALATENQLYDYMPPYVFNYHNKTAVHQENQIVPLGTTSTVFPGKPEYEYDRANKDNWGFRKNNVAAWSLSDITTPLGSNITFDYEEDDFYTEAFARRFWQEGLQFDINNYSSTEFELIISKDPDYVNWNIDFRDYFTSSKEAFLDLFICTVDEDYFVGCTAQRNTLDINKEGLMPLQVNELNIKFRLNKSYLTRLENSEDIYNNLFTPNDHVAGFGKFIETNRGVCPDMVNCQDSYTLKYKLLSNKVPPNTNGGGLRVKDITVDDNMGNTYITRYDYTNPNTGETSGITSFNPVKGEVFVPYQNELPGPGVMYEWVTMKALTLDENANEKELGSTQFNFHVLQPVFDIFNPNITMLDKDGDVIFNTTVTDKTMSFADVTAKDMKIEKNLSKIGQLISIEEFNEMGQSISKTTNTYGQRIGELSETFSSMKSVFDFEEDASDEYNQTNFSLIQRFLGLSTKSEKVSVLKKIETSNALGLNTLEYSEPDAYLGTFTAIHKQMADGNTVIERKIPAYTKYASMGSKINNVNNKNMLTQQAMQVSSYSNNTLNASITTWNNDWDYINYAGTVSSPSLDSEKIWRKHKSFVWKDGLNSNGTYSTTGGTITATSNKFDWGLGQPTDARWQEASEVTQYSHWSAALETKDINGNFAASKMGYDDSRVLASGNASTHEIIYTGAEAEPLPSSYIDHLVRGTSSLRSSETAHTGKYSLKITPSDNTFGGLLVGGKHREGKYRMSVWVNKGNYQNARFKQGYSGGLQSFNGETVIAGNWVQLNHYFDRSAAAAAGSTIFMVASNSGTIYVDDFRLHPVQSSMNSYVYHEDTGMLSHILDANNMGSKYVYDKAGRLCLTFVEIADKSRTGNNFNSNSVSYINGGFKVVSSNSYHYQSMAEEPCDECCIPAGGPM